MSLYWLMFLPQLLFIYVKYTKKSKIFKLCIILLQVLLDCGAVQADALTVDRLASLEKV